MSTNRRMHVEPSPKNWRLLAYGSLGSGRMSQVQPAATSCEADISTSGMVTCAMEGRATCTFRRRR